MNRLQKKCLIASASFHGLLILLLVFGAALMPDDRAAPATRITFFNVSRITDGPTQGGAPQGQPPAAAPTPLPPLAPEPPAPVAPPVQTLPQPVQPQPPVARETARLPDDFKPVLTPKSDSPSFKPVKSQTAKTDDFTPVDHPPKQTASNNQQADAQARAAAENQRRILSQINRGIGRLASTVGKDGAVEVGADAGGGEPSANYRDIVASIYTAAWTPPPSLTDDSASVVVSVTIGRDGHVVHHEIVKPSGNSAMDKSISNTLDNVTDIAPFPEDSKDTERTFTIKFNLSAKRSLG